MMINLANEGKKYSHNRCPELVNCVSVIIPTMNSAKTVGKCLESIRSQTYKNIEIFVLDGFSSDNTIEIASRFDVNIHLIAGERTIAKNFGISNSKGEFIFFIDSDMILQPRVVEECVMICSDDDRTAGVIIPERSIGSAFWVKVRDFERSLYAGSKMESARFFRKTFVVQVGGFDEDIVFYEESTLHQKLEKNGMMVSARISSFILHNETDFNLNRWLHKKHYYAVNRGQYFDRYQNYAKLQTSISYRIRVLLLPNGNWKRMARHPMLGIGVFILKALEFFASKV